MFVGLSFFSHCSVRNGRLQALVITGRAVDLDMDQGGEFVSVQIMKDNLC